MFNLRQFINAVEGLAEEENELREQVRILAYYASFDKFKDGDKMKIPDLYRLPGEEERKVKNKTDQSKKKQAYELLNKWN